MTRAASGPGGDARRQPRRVNAVTVDVEEWFHICGPVEGLAFDRWPALPSRVVLTTRLLLDDLDRAGTRATFFVLGWVAERHPELVAEILAAGHDVGSHGHLHTRVYELAPETFRAELRRSVAVADDRRCAGGVRLSGSGVVDQRSIALGARCPCARGLHHGREHGARQTGWRCHISAASACAGDAVRAYSGSATACRRPPGSGDAAWGGAGASA